MPVSFQHRIVEGARSLVIAGIAASTSTCVPIPALHTPPPPLAVEVYKSPQLPEGNPLAATSLPLVPGVETGTIGAFYRDYVSAYPVALPSNEPEAQRPAGVPLAQSSVPLLAQAYPINPDLLPYDMAAALVPHETQIAASPTVDSAGGVDGLFAAANALGYQIDDVSMDGTVATLSVSPLPGRSPHATDELAKLALASLPGIISTVINDARPNAEIVERGLDRKPPPLALSSENFQPNNKPAGRIMLTPPPPKPAVQGNSNDVYTVAQKVFDDLGKIGFTVRLFSIEGETAYLEFSQGQYRDNIVATSHAAHLVAQDAPPEVKIITLDEVESGSQVFYVSLMRGDFEKALAEKGSPEEVWTRAVLAGSDSDLPRGNEPAADSPVAANSVPAPAGGVDRLFAGAAALGYQIDDVSMDGDVATLSISPLPGRLPHATNELAKLAIANLPGITRTVINDARPGAGIVARDF